VSGIGPTGPPPSRLPARRRPRRLNKLPLLIGMATIGVCLAAGFYVMVSGQQRRQAADNERFDTAGAAPQADAVTTRAPNGPVIPATFGMAPPHAPPSAPPPPPQAMPAVAPSPSAVPWDLSPLAAEARTAAWKRYFSDLSQRQADQAKAVQVALTADTATGSASGRSMIGGPFGASADGQQAVQPLPGAASGGSGGGSIVNGGAFEPLDQPGGAAKGKQQSLFEQAGSSPATDYLRNGLTDPVSPFEIKAGDVITGVMLSGLTSESHGIVKAMVTKNVLDHATGAHILIPQGSQLVGVYQTGGQAGQERVEVGWERVIYPAPCDQSLDLGIMPGSDESGYSGFHDITDDHFWQIARNLLLASVFSAGIQLSQPQSNSLSGGYSSQQIIAGSIGQQLGEFGMEMARRGLDIPPTQKIRNGYSFTILATKDIAFTHAWEAGLPGEPGTCRASMQVTDVH
jgi:type IV secretion system protein VirB10